MTTGILGTKNLYAETPQSIYACDKSGGAIIAISICNRGNTSTYVSLAVGDTVNTPTNDEWIEYKLEIKPKCVLERTSIALAVGQQIIVNSSNDNVNAVCWGIEVGDSTAITSITTNDTPPWSSDTTIYANVSTSVPLIQGSNPFSGTYAVTSGSPPGGMSLNAATGSLTGIPSAASYLSAGVTSTFTVTATVPSGTYNKIFNITRKWYDGSSKTLAATSANQLKTDTGITTDGSYWIKPVNCPEAFLLHCYMSIESGGWMLVLRNAGGELGYFGSGSFLVSDWAGWGYSTKAQIDALGFNYSVAEDSNCFTPVYAHSPFNDVMVIANRSGQQTKRVGWRHASGFNRMYDAISTPTEKVASSTLFGNPYSWLTQLDVRSDTTQFTATGTTKVGFKIRSDTGSQSTTSAYYGGFHTDAMHYGSQIGCGRDNSNAGEWGGGFGGYYNGSGRFHRLHGHWWNFGDGRSNAAWSANDQSSAFLGHAVYVR